MGKRNLTTRNERKKIMGQGVGGSGDSVPPSTGGSGVRRKLGTGAGNSPGLSTGNEHRGGSLLAPAHEGRAELFEFRVGPEGGFDLVEGVDDRGVVAPAELPPDIGQRQAGELAAEVHGQVAGDDEGA